MKTSLLESEIAAGRFAVMAHYDMQRVLVGVGRRKYQGESVSLHAMC